MSLFGSTAAYYTRFRPRYPAELIERLAAAAALDRKARVLDLGSGPGFLAVPLAAYVGEVVAVDPEAEMLAELPPSIHAVRGRAEDVDASWGSFRLVTIGRAFHWMDPGILDRLPTDQVALVGDKDFESEPITILRETARELLGERPPMKQPWVQYEDALAQSSFDDVTTITVVDERTWTVDQLIGLAYSTSFASQQRLGDRRPEFERMLRERLKPLYRERVSVDAVLGRRRDE